MTKVITLIGLVPTLVLGQSLVHNTPENRIAFLEDFTGIHCGYCPEGHAIMANLEETLGNDRFVTVGVHAGGYAVPSGGEPDFRTDAGTALDAHFTISGYPAGVINRHLFNGEDDLGRGAWEGAVNDMLALPSPVNVGVESHFNSGTRELTVHVHALYTANSPAGNDYVSVFIKEDHIVGYQSDYTNGAHPAYDHKHVLRDYITDTWGEDVGDHVAGDEVDRTYTYTVPVEWNIANCQVVAFVSEYQTEVYQARQVIADGGTTLVIGALQGDAQPFRAGSSGTADVFSATFTSGIGSDQPFVVNLDDQGQPGTWQATFTIGGNTYPSGSPVTLQLSSTENIMVQITPSSEVGIGVCTLSIVSQDNINAPVLLQDFHVISGVTDLIVSNPEAETHLPVFDAGLQLEPGHANTSRVTYINFAQANALDGVNNLYMNISWTFPSYTDEVAAALAAFMDNGGNVMISGQDIGWDQSGAANSYGTPATQQFYTDYLLSTFVADGSTADNQVDLEDGDAVFGPVASSSIADVFGGNTYPDQITPIAPAVAIARYSAAKIGGVRAQTSTHKLVYLAVGPEQLSDADVAHMLVQLSHDWFYGIVSVEEFDAAMNALGQAYPSPANEQVSIPLGTLSTSATLDVFDATGRLVASRSVQPSTAAIVDTRSFEAGLYTARLRGTLSHASTFVVAH